MSRAAASFLTLLVVLTAALAAGTATASAAEQPCWKRVLDDWQEDGRIDGVYPAQCYREALRHVPEDIRAYSSFPDDVRRARQEVFRTPQSTDPSDPGSGETGGSGGSAGERRLQEREPETGHDEGPIDSALNRLGSKDSDSVPLPLLILAALAATLMIAGGAGFAHRKLRGRRPPP
jgi:hypothetical protein